MKDKDIGLRDWFRNLWNYMSRKFPCADFTIKMEYSGIKEDGTEPFVLECDWVNNDTDIDDDEIRAYWQTAIEAGKANAREVADGTIITSGDKI